MDCILKARRLRNGRRKTSVKITVSADIPSDNGSYYHSCKSSSESSVQHEVIKKIVIEEDTSSDGTNNEDGSNNESRATKKSKKTRVTVDDSIVDYPTCIDFGIQDFLCCKDEIDLELSNSDTDTSFLEATPPHRFSDSELESQIEIMSITLDTVLNLGSTPVSDWANRSMSKDDIFTVDLRVEHLDEDSQLDETQNELKELEQNDEPLLIQDDNSSTTHLEENMKGKVATEEMDGKNDCGSPEKKIKTDSIPRKRPPLRPFRRQISLPASIFMSYLLAAEKNLATKADNNNGQRKTDFSGMQNHNSLKKINQNNSQVVYGSRRILSKINGSCSSSNESTEEHDHNEEEGSEGNVGEMEMRSLMTSVDDSSLSSSTTTTPIYLNGDELSLGQDDTRNKDVSSISSNRMSFSDAQDDNTGHVDSSAAFTSEIERRSLLLRYMRRLIRQDTSVNFAPNDYCI